MECVICGKPISKKARTCSAKCKQELYRRNRNTTVTTVTPATVTSPTVTDLEKCRYCGEPLPPLLKPRRHPGSCYECALKAPRKPSIVALGDTVYRPFTGSLQVR